MSAMRGREKVLLSVVVVVVVAVGIRRAPAARSSSVSRDPVMRGGTAVKIAAATWLGRNNFMQ